MKFHQLAIGETFTLDRVGECVKVSPTQYRNPYGTLRRTTGTANVNGPSAERVRAATVKAENERLNQIAQVSGFRTWHELGRAALAGERIEING